MEDYCKEKNYSMFGLGIAQPLKAKALIFCRFTGFTKMQLI